MCGLLGQRTTGTTSYEKERTSVVIHINTWRRVCLGVCLASALQCPRATSPHQTWVGGLVGKSPHPACAKGYLHPALVPRPTGAPVGVLVVCFPLRRLPCCEEAFPRPIIAPSAIQRVMPPSVPLLHTIQLVQNPCSHPSIACPSSLFSSSLSWCPPRCFFPQCIRRMWSSTKD